MPDMRRTLAYLYCIVGVVVSLAVVSQSHAQPTASEPAPTVVVIIDSGNTDLLVESLVRSTAEAELTKRGYHLVEGAEVGGDTPQKLLACAGNPQCSVETLASISATYVIFISLRPDEEGKSDNFKIVARNYEVATGTALARTMRRCTECKEEVDLASFSKGVIADLIREPTTKAPVVPETPIEPTATPATPATPAAPTVIEEPSINSSDEGSGVVTGLKYATLVGGVAGLAAGTVLVLIDGPVIRDGERLREERETLLGGYGALAGGAVLLGVSAWLFSVDHDDDSRSHASILPTVQSDGGSLVWMGTF
tara:strand:+ start:68883 stop:69812 length:930 start_codon:yes stop_codon:yes gene_type:complete